MRPARNSNGHRLFTRQQVEHLQFVRAQMRGRREQRLLHVRKLRVSGFLSGQHGVVATLQEKPSQLNKALGGLGWPLTHPAIQIMYRSPVDIYIAEWIHDLLQLVGGPARRVVIDSLMDLQIAAVDDTWRGRPVRLTSVLATSCSTV